MLDLLQRSLQDRLLNYKLSSKGDSNSLTLDSYMLGGYSGGWKEGSCAWAIANAVSRGSIEQLRQLVSEVVKPLCNLMCDENSKIVALLALETLEQLLEFGERTNSVPQEIIDLKRGVLEHWTAVPSRPSSGW